MPPHAILFDLDDTLADRQAGLRIYASRFATDFARRLIDPSVEAAHRAIRAADDFGSMRQAEALRRAAIWHEAPISDDLNAHWQKSFGACATPFPGALDLLRALNDAGIKLGLVTNGAAAMQRAKIAALGLDPLFGAIVISAEVGLRKPDPAIFELAVGRLGCASADCWFVGDHPEQDVRGAHKAGLRAFWVRTGAFEADNVPGDVLWNLAELGMHLSPCYPVVASVTPSPRA